MKNKTAKHPDWKTAPIPKEKAQALTAEEAPFDLRRFLGICAAVSLVVFLCGYLLMTIAVKQIDYAGLVFAGTHYTDENGVAHFTPNYPYFSTYAVGANESLFSRTGALGTGLYFYSVVNALHWIIEMKYENLRMIVFLPMLVIFFGACYLFYKFLPLRSQTNQNAALLGFGVGAFHGVITIAFVMLGKMISTDFASFYTSSFHFIGQLAGLMVPSITILLLTDLTYGGVAGGILVAVHGICSLKKSITP